MSNFGYNLGPPDEQIYVYQQPTRPSWGGLFAGTAGDRPRRDEPISWTERLQQKLNKLQGHKDLTEPMYWVYLLIAFALLALVLVGFYWILQSARVAVLKKQIMTRQAIAAAVASATAPLPPRGAGRVRALPLDTYGNSPTAIVSPNLNIDNSGRNPEICRSGTCPGTSSLLSNGGGMLENNNGAPRLTYSASAGLAPITLGSTIHGGLGRDICIGCKCIGCDTPGKCSNVFAGTVGVPYLPSTSIAAQCGSGYSRDPYLA